MTLQVCKIAGSKSATTQGLDSLHLDGSAFVRQLTKAHPPCILNPRPWTDKPSSHFLPIPLQLYFLQLHGKTKADD